MLVKISPTLIDKWDFYNNAPLNWQQTAWEGLLATIQKQPFVTTPAIERGFMIENILEKLCKKQPLTAQEREFATPLVLQQAEALSLQHVQWQQWTAAVIECSNATIKLQGKIDCLCPDKIIDIKTTLNYKPQKYENGWQRPFYCYMQQVPVFEFIVFIWDAAARNEITDVKTLRYEYTDQEMAALPLRLSTKIDAFIGWLQLMQLWETYQTNFGVHR